MLQYRTLKASVKDIDARTVTGYFSAFGNVDSDKDIIMPGAFKRTIKERGPSGAGRIFHLFQHDAYRPLGKPKVLKEDNNGLYFETTLPKTTLANDTLELYKAGIYNEHSIGYEVLDSDMTKVDGESVQQIKEMMLWEGSTVTWGANKETPVTGIKSLQKDQKGIEDKINRIQKFLRKGEVTDDTFELLEYQLQQLKLSVPSQEEQEDPEPSQEDLKDNNESMAAILDQQLTKVKLNNYV